MKIIKTFEDFISEEALRAGEDSKVIIDEITLDSGSTIKAAEILGDAESLGGAEHHLGALHVVVHYILKSWLKCLLVDEVEVNFFICDNLDSLVSLDEVDLTSHVVELLILSPSSSLLILFEE